MAASRLLCDLEACPRIHPWRLLSFLGCCSKWDPIKRTLMVQEQCVLNCHARSDSDHENHGEPRNMHLLDMCLFRDRFLIEMMLMGITNMCWMLTLAARKLLLSVVRGTLEKLP